MDLRDWLTIAALATGPTIAILISLKLQEQARARAEKVQILRTIAATRHAPLADDRLRALNTIDVVFAREKTVRAAWGTFLKAISREDFATSADTQRDATEKNTALIREMAKSLGLEKEYSELDIQRVYSPKGLATNFERGEALATELLRVLKSTKSLGATPREPGEEEK